MAIQPLFVDEVNELFRTRADKHDSLKFLALCRAFGNWCPISPSETDRKSFAFRSDTSSNVSYITPPYDCDPSANFKRHLQLLRPLYPLDLFVEDGQSAAGDGIDLSRIFSLDRSLRRIHTRAKPGIDHHDQPGSPQGWLWKEHSKIIRPIKLWLSYLTEWVFISRVYHRQSCVPEHKRPDSQAV